MYSSYVNTLRHRIYNLYLSCMCNYYMLYILHICVTSRIYIYCYFSFLRFSYVLMYMLHVHLCMHTYIHMGVHMKTRSQCQVSVVDPDCHVQFCLFWDGVSCWYVGLANSDGLAGYRGSTRGWLLGIHLWLAIGDPLVSASQCCSYGWGVPHNTQLFQGFWGLKWQSGGQSDLRGWSWGLIRRCPKTTT